MQEIKNIVSIKATASAKVSVDELKEEDPDDAEGVIKKNEVKNESPTGND